MSIRQYALPVATLGLSTTALTGCGADGLVGEWLLTEIDVDGYDYQQYIDGVTYEDDGCTYTYRTEFTLEFDDKDGDTLEGEFKQTYVSTYSGACGTGSYSESYSYDAEATVVKARTYEIEVDDFDMELDCTLDGDELECEGEVDEVETELVFERQ